MRRVLVLGGTGWLGRAIVDALIAEGAEVVCLARGTSGAVSDGARLVGVDRRSPGAYEQVRGDWDEVIELTHEPEMVLPALDALADRAAHWTLISSVSVYARNDEVDADETAALVDPLDLVQYADAKVAAEQAASTHLSSRLLIARPGLIIGPGDPSDRFGYWPARFSRSGPVLVPTTAGRFVQAVDVRDLARWVVRAAGAGRVGVVNAVGAAIPMGDFFRMVVDVTGHDGEVVEVEDDALLEQDVAYWAGPRSLPLWLPMSDVGFAQRSGHAFHQAGGLVRPLPELLADVLADERARGVDRTRRSGLTAREEAAVLRSIR
ncbi:NAD-dependent epimerase/dehydratase family protein [Curtobacterium sp. VKM Ac-1393]|uniref:NAD-dependent epimerase/dehydratase family protein n=1 Tax=Curtobacterium sp. VKM Ac-1393 TaxID=2783814 RepID=UPI00188D72DB|nr:NAD-dependent epimerase/dehydratase family protein [Curtobacterium sp. VKM Ac-1393]MBF4606382.1 NAD-dependent epimerase/dehydratase family protein [Curtobacterium sp. VKM Ac-1393]